MKKLLVVTAHPDDESFGPGGTIARYAKEGVEVHVMCATRGESGENSLDVGSEKWEAGHRSGKLEVGKDQQLHTVREQELLSASKILGVKKVEFLNFIDGTLNNAQYHAVAEKIIQKINDFAPQVIITFDQNGVSGHLDHVAISFITTYAYLKTTAPQKLYYHCVSPAWQRQITDYFVYFPPGRTPAEITTMIDVSSVWDIRVEAMKQHKTQMHDVARLLEIMNSVPKEEYYIRFDSKVPVVGKETDLFEGIPRVILK